MKNDQKLKDGEGPAGADKPSHMLSFDVEEYFQVEAAAISGVGPEEWDSFERRVAPSVAGILRLLADRGVFATFFILGWLGRHERNVVRMIADAGHEIASHGMNHAMLHRLTPEQFRNELLDSRRLLEDISGRAVVGFRAPTFSLTHQTARMIDVLAETGYQYDSSVFPVRHDRYGVPDAPQFIHRAIGPGGGEVLEIPPLTLRMLGMNWPVGGGGYFRLLPVRLIAAGLNRAQKLGQAGMIYLHSWEFDADQPALHMGRLNRWRHRVNLSKTQAKLERLLQNFDFSSVGQFLRSSGAVVKQAYSYGLTKSASGGPPTD